MRRTRVKICGVMRPDDAAMAAACGADAVGIILHPASPRNVAIETAGRIIAALPPLVTPVGLFVNSTAEHILSVSRQLGLRHVQLHGEESPELVAELAGLVIIKAVRASVANFTQSLNRWRNVPNLRAIVLETDNTSRPGGTGIENNWELIRAACEAGHFAGLPPIIAAGGLNPRNVGDVVRWLGPWAVDVSSGVERVRGEKSDVLVREFIEAIERADADLGNGGSVQPLRGR
jgi:phosphoribosylanthranilate isomerase